MTVNPWARSLRVESNYARQLRKIARHVAQLIKAHGVVDPKTRQIDASVVPNVQRSLDLYSAAITPWAEATARRIVEEIALKNRDEWFKQAKEMSAAIRQELRDAPTGAALKQFMAEQVRLITSIPIEAGQRVHRLTMEALETAGRYDDVAADILATEKVTVSRANLIARTETARTVAGFNMVRAQHIGSEEYIWRTVRDADVRKAHRQMEGKVIRWDTPPTLSDGTTTHAGMIYNCFTGATLVRPSSPVVRIFRALYRGPMLRLTVGDVFFDVTPNHPLLTVHGWREAGGVMVGQDVLRIAGPSAEAMTFEACFTTLGRNAEHRLQSITDFYGDPMLGTTAIIKPHAPAGSVVEPLALCAAAVTGRDITDFCGPVYTMETQSGQYGVTSAGVLARNCRCYAEVVIPDRF